MDAKQRVQEKKPEHGIEIAGTTAAYKQNEKKLKFKGNFSCEFCIHDATRLSSWNALCDACSKSHDKRYNLGDKRLQVRIVEERFPNKHRGAKSCPSSSCPEKNLTILYDEVDDEWLYCGHCKKFKQLLRCWNMYTNTMVDYLERPMMKQSMGAIQDADFMSDESDDSRIASDSDDSADSDASSHLETEVSEMSLEGKSLGAVYSDDLPPLEELLVEDKAAKVKKPKAKKKKAKTKKIASNSAASLANDNNDSDKEMPGLIDTSGSDSSREAREKRITKSKLPKAAR